MNDAVSAPTDRRAPVRGPLFTDSYELTMAELYFHEGIADRPAQFDYFFRNTPDYGTHQAGYCVAAGLRPFLTWLAGLHVGADELAELAALVRSDGSPLFDPAFLRWLSSTDRLRGLEIHAIGEGRVVHPYEPVVSVTGPLAITQLIETSLLNHLNYSTLIATKAARVVQSARGGRVLEFGTRRGPGAGVDEGIRAALIAGCSGTSNVETSIKLGTTPRGTHAHSLVQAFLAIGGAEIDAFRAIARSAPSDCVLLVDTIDTLHSGVPNAIVVFEELRAAGHEPSGVRLDSGDLAYLAVQTSKQLDAAGFPDVTIVLSGDLDELTIWQILAQIDDEANREGLAADAVRRRLAYGVGTRLLTSQGDPSLNGVYKLVGIHDDQRRWAPAIKMSEDPDKVPIPGRKRVWRLYDRRDFAVTDLIGLRDEDPLESDEFVVHHPTRAEVHTTHRRDHISRVEELHVEVPIGGEPGNESIDELRERCRADIEHLDVGVRRLVNPHRYHVSLTDRLHRLRSDLIEQTSASSGSRTS